MIYCTEKSFDELTTEQKEQAIEANRDFGVHDQWWDATYESWAEKLENLGFSCPDIQFSGFWSQGDGASFTAESLPCLSKNKDVKEAWEILQHALTLIGGEDDLLGGYLEDVAKGRVYRSSYHYSHENTVTVDWGWESYYVDPGSAAAEAIKHFEAAVECHFQQVSEQVKDLSREIYKDLEKEHEYLTSDAYVAEMLEANEVKFEIDEEGDLLT